MKSFSRNLIYDIGDFKYNAQYLPVDLRPLLCKYEEIYVICIWKKGQQCVSRWMDRSLRLERSYCKAKYVSCKRGCCFFYRMEVIRFNTGPSSLSYTTSWKIGVPTIQGHWQTLSCSISIIHFSRYEITYILLPS